MTVQGLTVELSETPKPGEVAVDFSTMHKNVRREVRHKFIEHYVRSRISAGTDRRVSARMAPALRSAARILWDRAVASKSISVVASEGEK